MHPLETWQRWGSDSLSVIVLIHKNSSQITLPQDCSEGQMQLDIQ